MYSYPQGTPSTHPWSFHSPNNKKVPTKFSHSLISPLQKFFITLICCMWVLFITINWNQSWRNTHETIQFFVHTWPMTSNTSHLTTSLIKTTSSMRGWTDSKALTIPSTNGDMNKLSNTSLSNVTWTFKTSHPSQHLTCILNKSHYTNLHNYTCTFC